MKKVFNSLYAFINFFNEIKVSGEPRLPKILGIAANIAYILSALPLIFGAYIFIVSFSVEYYPVGYLLLSLPMTLIYVVVILLVGFCLDSLRRILIAAEDKG